MLLINAFLLISRSFPELLAIWDWLVFCLLSGKTEMVLLRKGRFSLALEDGMRNIHDREV